MRCKWLNNLMHKLTTVEVIIQTPDGLCTVRTTDKLDKVIADYKGTSCKVIAYNGKLVEQTEE